MLLHGNLRASDRMMDSNERWRQYNYSAGMANSIESSMIIILSRDGWMDWATEHPDCLMLILLGWLGLWKIIL